MASPTAPGSANGEGAAARETWSQRVRRRWRSRGRHARLRYWMLFRGLPIGLGFGALFVATGLVIGWHEAYDVALAIDPPWATRSPALALLLSMAGWLVAPGVAGAVAGYVISAAIDGRRRVPMGTLFLEDEDD